MHNSGGYWDTPVGCASSERNPRAAIPASTGTSSLRLSRSAERGLEGPAEWGRGSGSPWGGAPQLCCAAQLPFAPRASAPVKAGVGRRQEGEQLLRFVLTEKVGAMTLQDVNLSNHFRKQCKAERRRDID